MFPFSKTRVTVTVSKPVSEFDWAALPEPAKLRVVPAFRGSVPLSKPPVKMFGMPTGRSTSKASVLAEAAVCDFVAAKVSDRLTVRISPTSRARRSVANKPPLKPHISHPLVRRGPLGYGPRDKSDQTQKMLDFQHRWNKH